MALPAHSSQVPTVVNSGRAKRPSGDSSLRYSRLLGAWAGLGRRHRSPGRISCTEVRYYVAKYSAPLAEMYARNHGATDAQIERARRCLVSNESAETERPRSYTN